MEYSLFAAYVDGTGLRKRSLSGMPWLSPNWHAALKPNRTKRICAESVRIAIDEAANPAADRNLEAPKVPASVVQESLVKLFRGEELFAADYTWLPQKILRDRDRAEASLAAVCLLIALRRYRSVYGELPGAIDRLVPEFLTRIPRDPADGKPFRYSRAKKILYSAGQDGIDAGGSQKSDPAEAELDRLDPTYRIPW